MTAGSLWEKKEQKTYKVVMPNDLVYNPANLRWGAIAVSKIRHPVVVSPIYEVLYKRPDIDFNENFVFESLMRPEQIKVFCLKGQGTLVERIAVKIDDFVTESIPLPPTLPEQTHIAACLSSLDAVIDAHTDKLAALRLHKRALMQQLFPQEGEKVPRLRFPEFEGSGEWEEKRLGEVAYLTAGATPSTSKKEYWGGDIPWMASGDIHQKRVTDVIGRITELGLKSSSTKILPVNSVLVALAGQGKTRGTVATNAIELCTNQSIAAIIPTEEIDYKFLFLNLDSRYEELRSLSTGEGGRGGLNLGILRDVKIPLPPKPEEQTHIAACLSSLDDLIKAQSEKIDELKTFKRGLMQGLFPRGGEE